MVTTKRERGQGRGEGWEALVAAGWTPPMGTPVALGEAEAALLLQLAEAGSAGMLVPSAKAGEAKRLRALGLAEHAPLGQHAVRPQRLTAAGMARLAAG